MRARFARTPEWMMCRKKTLALYLSTGVIASVMIQQTANATDPALFSNLSTAGQSSALFTINGQPNPDPGTSGEITGGGDDYNTGYNIIRITGLSFYGGQTDAYQMNYGLQVNFYSTAGVRVASIPNVSVKDTFGIGLHTIDPNDFHLNGLSYIPVYGSGYIVFSPNYFTLTNYNSTTGITTTYPEPGEQSDVFRPDR
jgi:hypothetical protein